MKRIIGKILFWAILVMCGFTVLHGVEIALSPDNQAGRFLVSIFLFFSGGILGLCALYALVVLGSVADWLCNMAFDTKNEEK